MSHRRRSPPDPLSRATEAWATLEAALAELAPSVQRGLPPGATEAQLDDFASAVGVELPPLFRAVYSIHDGMGIPAVDAQLISNQVPLLSLSDSRRFWEMLRDVQEQGHFRQSTIDHTSGPVRADWWNAKWIPIGQDGAGSAHCLDLDPADPAHVGQVIEYWHDYSSRSVVAPDVASYLEEIDAGEVL